MGDMTKFNSAIEYYIFNVLLMCLLISEIFIFFYTRSKQNRTEKIDTRDLGTKWLLYLNFVFCLIISFLCISQKAPFCIRELTLPAYFAKIGMLIIAVGICIRIKAVLTLKKAFFSMLMITAGILGCVFLVWAGVEQYKKIWDDLYKMVLISSISFVAVLGNLIREYLPLNLILVILFINIGTILLRAYLKKKYPQMYV